MRARRRSRTCSCASSSPTRAGSSSATCRSRAIDIAAWRAHLAWVPQRPYLFHGTVADNLRLARPDAGDDDVRAAARDAGAERFIDALPGGFDAPLGEDGLRLSGGQRQRLAIARAFLADARLVILDEATSHLDAESETVIRDAVGRLAAQGRTVLVVSHRLRLAEVADMVAVVDAGRIVKAGTTRGTRTPRGPYRTPAQFGRRAMTIVRRLLALTASRRRWIVIGAGLGFLAVGSNVLLMAASAYLISRSALITNVAEVALVITSVRVLAIGRAAFRYLERYVTHRATFEILTDLRVWFFAAIEPLAPAGLPTGAAATSLPDPWRTSGRSRTSTSASSCHRSWPCSWPSSAACFSVPSRPSSASSSSESSR